MIHRHADGAELMTAPRVAYLHSTTFFGGASKSLLLALEALGERVERRVVISDLEPGPMAERFRGAARCLEQLRFPLLSHNRADAVSRWQRRRARWASRRPSRELAARLREWRTQVLHVNSTVFAPALASLRDQLPDVRIVTHAREEILAGDPMSDWFIAELRRHSDVVIAISENEALAYRGHPGLEVVLNPVVMPDLSPERGLAFRRRHGLSADTLLFGMMGHFMRTKGQLELLRAVAALLARGFPRERFRCVIIGWKEFPAWREAVKRVLRPGSYSLDIQRCVAANDLARNLIIVPSTHAVEEPLSALDVVVRPSTLGDPWGRDVIEAMSWAKPIVATGTSEVFVEPGRTGFLVPPCSDERMAERIQHLLERPELRAELGERGRALVETRCNPEAHAGRLLAIYRRLVQA